VILVLKLTETPPRVGRVLHLTDQPPRDQPANHVGRAGAVVVAAAVRVTGGRDSAAGVDDRARVKMIAERPMNPNARAAPPYRTSVRSGNPALSDFFE